MRPTSNRFKALTLAGAAAALAGAAAAQPAGTTATNTPLRHFCEIIPEVDAMEKEISGVISTPDNEHLVQAFAEKLIEFRNAYFASVPEVKAPYIQALREARRLQLIDADPFLTERGLNIEKRAREECAPKIG